MKITWNTIKTGSLLYVKRNIEARLRNHYCRGKTAKYYIYWVCVCSLRYPACIAHAPCYIVICGLSASTVFFHIVT